MIGMNGCALTDAIKYIGVNDTTIDLFESQYEVLDGISYNSYTIMDEKIAVMDSVDKRGEKEWFANLERALDGRKPDFLIIQHMEPDHSGSALLFMEKYPEATLVCSERAAAMFSQFFTIDLKLRHITVKEGDRLVLGKHSLTFFMAPMVHWPEVMVTYEETEKVLFSADAFGAFGALEGELGEQESIESIVNMASKIEYLRREWLDEARRYYINIVGKYGVQVQALLKKLTGLEIRMICPLHGPMLAENIDFCVEKYHTWSCYQPEQDGVVIAYASIYGNTAMAAQKLSDILSEKGIRNMIYDLARDDESGAVAQAFAHSKLIVACPTYDGGLFPCVETFLNKLKAKNYQKRSVGIIENGTWAPVAGKLIKDFFACMKEIEVLEPTVTVLSTLNEESREQLAHLVEALALD